MAFRLIWLSKYTILMHLLRLEPFNAIIGFAVFILPLYLFFYDKSVNKRDLNKGRTLKKHVNRSVSEAVAEINLLGDKESKKWID